MSISPYTARFTLENDIINPNEVFYAIIFRIIIKTTRKTSE